MRKAIFTFLAIIFTVSIGYSQVTTLWERSQATANMPSWFGTDLTRGLAFGNDHVYIVSRTGGSFVYIYNAATGDSIGTLRTDGISGGTYAVSDVEVSSNGVIFVCNLTTAANSSALKVYKYTTETDSPIVAINYTGVTAARLGDKFTVTGSTADNSIVIWFASANTKELYKFTTVDNGTSFTATVIPLPSLATVASYGSASVGPLSNGDFYYNASGQNAEKFLADGTVIDTVSGSIVATGSNAIRFISTLSSDEYFVTFAYGTGNQNGRIVKIPGGDINLAELVGTTNILGSNANVNGAGDVAIQKVSNYFYNIYVLSTNNGFGAYQVDLRAQLTGDYYIGSAGTGPGGSDPDYPTLEAAFNVINNASITGDCNFFITSDITEPNTAHGLGLAVDPSPNTITFKPFTGVQPVITLQYPVDINSGPSGAFVIGIPSDNNIAWNDLRTTKNIVIDGSNTVGGTTRDLTIQSSLTAQRNAFPITIVGDVSNLIVKNTNIYYKAQGVSTSGNLFVSAVQVRSRNNLSADYVPHDLTFENNHISSNFDGVVQSAQGYGTYQSGTPVPALLPYNITLINNLIEGKRRAVTLYLAGSHDIIGNEIILNQNISTNTTNEAIYAVNVIAGSVINIYDNKISKLFATSFSLANSGNTGISIETAGTYNIYNNFIYGFGFDSSSVAAYLRGIKNSSATATLNLNFNSVYMPNLNYLGSAPINYTGIYLSDGTNNLGNNIVYTVNQSGAPTWVAYCIYRLGTAGTLTSNYNNFYPEDSYVGYWNTADAITLTNWQTASGQDANSKSKVVSFVSATDLHLTGSSIGDLDLAGTPIAGITTDIDGDVRSTTFPYMGADEGLIPLPVELTAFSASYTNGSVLLKWTTATETNNQGFEIQRKSSGDFETLGFVNGNGTTTQTQSYSFIDNEVNNSVYSYRLKQVDYDGTFSYSNVIEVDVTSPLQFELSQNYPNPFNPTTMINYQIAAPVNVNLVVFNMLGEEVAVLLNNQFTEAGTHSVRFDGSSLASGTYIYRLTAGNFVQTKKMMLTK
ncbi:MAG: T9SS type A sorting domain-containing protein [Ignavibacteriales bacterium]|nr:T9SS type A sorting domain-containing protein [Ignavibacteriales bacterium]